MTEHGNPALLVCACTLVACIPGKPHVSEFDIGVDSRINAIIAVPERGLGLFAAASRGLIVNEDGHRWKLSNHELRALTTDDAGHYWVCGDQGYLAFTSVDHADIDDPNIIPTWTTVASETEVNCHDLAATAERVVIVAEDLLLVGVENDGVWQLSEPTPPDDGWGRLRAVSDAGGEFLAVGLDGRALLSSADADTWTVLDEFDPDADFTILCGSLALGDDLIHAHRTADGWVSGGGGGTADYVGCGGAYVLSSDRWISRLGSKGRETIYRVPWQVRAFDRYGFFVAGDDGHVAVWIPAELHEL